VRLVEVAEYRETIRAYFFAAEYGHNAVLFPEKRYFYGDIAIGICIEECD
jgi:hypothetical protein